MCFRVCVSECQLVCAHSASQTELYQFVSRARENLRLQAQSYRFEGGQWAWRDDGILTVPLLDFVRRHGAWSRATLNEKTARENAAVQEKAELDRQARVRVKQDVLVAQNDPLGITREQTEALQFRDMVLDYIEYVLLYIQTSVVPT